MKYVKNKIENRFLVKYFKKLQKFDLDRSYKYGYLFNIYLSDNINIAGANSWKKTVKLLNKSLNEIEKLKTKKQVMKYDKDMNVLNFYLKYGKSPVKTKLKRYKPVWLFRRRYRDLNSSK